jgi:hypothetical protein
MKIIIALAVFACVPALFGQETPSGKDQRNTPITVNLIVDGSAGLSGPLEKINSWLSGRLLDELLLPGDKLSIWSAGASAQILYSDTLKTGNDKENIKKVLQTLPSRGDSADFLGALRAAASASAEGGGIIYTLLISASPVSLSSALSGPAAALMRFSRVEESQGWGAYVIALNIDSRVRQAASSFLSGT